MMKMTLSKKLSLSFGALIVMAAAVGAVGWTALERAHVGFDTYRGIARDTNAAGRVQANFLMTRLHAKDYMHAGKPEDLASQHAAFARTEGLVHEALKEFKDPQRIEEMKAVAGALAEYKDAFVKAAALTQQRQSFLANGYPERADEKQRELDALVEGTLTRLGNEISKNTEDIKLDAKSEQDDLGPRLQADNRRSEIFILIFLSFAVISGVGLTFFLTRSLTRPILRAVTLAKEISLGDFTQRLTMRRSDEIGDLAQALDAMAVGLEKKAEVAETIASGRLDVVVPLASEKDKLGQALKTMTDSLNDILDQVTSSGEQIASGAGQVSDASQSLSQGATEQASSLEEVTSSLAEISSQTQQNAENASLASRLATETRDAAERGNRQMGAMVQAMGEINAAAGSISRIIKTIDEIAFQTNLLALNAAVEAARAGQHGKGFAVVAEEVRNLAARSATAARETADLIEGSVTKTRNGADIADETAKSLSEMVSSVTKVTDLVAEIAAASGEQAQGIAQINLGMGQIDQVTQQNTANAEESAAAAEELAGQAEQMRQMLARFTLRKGQGSSRPSPVQARVGWSKPAPSRETPSASLIALDDSEFGKF